MGRWFTTKACLGSLCLFGDLSLVQADDGVCSPKGKMKQVQISGFNAEDPLSTVAVIETDIPEPSTDQILVRMTYMPVNPADFFSLMGVYPGFQPESLPAVPGLEGCGVVEAIGPRSKIPKDSKGLKVGSRVVPLFTAFDQMAKEGGSWSEYKIVPIDDLILIPEGVTDESAAQLHVNPMTAIGMLDELDPPKGEYILQGAGGSTLGKQLIQIANARGLHVISTVRRCEQVEEVMAYGSPHDHVICTDTEDIVQRVLELTGKKGAYGAVDPIAGDSTQQFQDSVRDGGTILVYGALAGLDYKGSVVSTLFRDTVTKGYWITAHVAKLKPLERRNFMRNAMDYLSKGIVVPHSGKTFPMEQVVDAVEEANRPGRSSEGKVLLKTNPNCGRRSDEL